MATSLLHPMDIVIAFLFAIVFAWSPVHAQNTEYSIHFDIEIEWLGGVKVEYQLSGIMEVTPGNKIVRFEACNSHCTFFMRQEPNTVGEFKYNNFPVPFDVEMWMKVEFQTNGLTFTSGSIQIFESVDKQYVWPPVGMVMFFLQQNLWYYSGNEGFVVRAGELLMFP